MALKDTFRILKNGKVSMVLSAILVTTTIAIAAPQGGTVSS
ncbi:MAG: hypothetical protein RL154_57, partial [Pseudomonadota bacterium]